MIVKVEVDIITYDDETADDVARSMATASGRDIEYTVISEHGPTGWPIVHFEGPVAQVESMLIEHGFDDPLETFQTQ